MVIKQISDDPNLACLSPKNTIFWPQAKTGCGVDEQVVLDTRKWRRGPTSSSHRSCSSDHFAWAADNWAWTSARRASCSGVQVKWLESLWLGAEVLSLACCTSVPEEIGRAMLETCACFREVRGQIKINSVWFLIEEEVGEWEVIL